MANQGPPPAQQQQQQQVAQQNAVMALFSRLRDVGANIVAERKAWTEMVDRSSFGKPASFADATSRLRKNTVYFRVNYLIIILIVTAVCMALNPSALAVLGLLGVLWLYLFVVRQAPLVLGGRTFSNQEKFIAMVVISVVVVFFLTSVGTLLFTAIGISAALIGLHGALRVPDDLFLDESEMEKGGLFSFLTGRSPP